MPNLERVIYCFWTGHNKMSSNRERCFNTLSKSECKIKSITPKNVKDFIKSDYPLHPAFNYLSLTHKSDYLRCYFMHHYGGGYSDIKETTSSWEQAFADIDDEKYYINGYQEIGPNVVANVEGDAYLQLQKNYQSLIGCCAFICKPQTPFTTDWYNQLHQKLDNYYPLLKKYPAIHPQEKKGMLIAGFKSQYPVPWTDILGNIVQPLCLKYKSNIKQTLPLCVFKDYR